MSLKFITLAVARRIELAGRFIALLLVSTFAVGSAHAQTETVTYAGAVDDATGAFFALTPVGTIVGGPIVVDATALANGAVGIADINSIDVNVGNFCFATAPGTCSGVGALVPITAINTANITGSAGTLRGSFSVTAFSPTFMVSIPISFDLDNGRFSADGGALGTVAGFGALTSPLVAAPAISTLPAVGTALDFGTVAVASGVTTQTIVVSSVGDLGLTISAITPTGFPADLVLSEDCPTAPLDALTGMCTITLTLNPATLGNFNASVLIANNDENVSFDVTGSIVPPAALSSTAPMSTPLMIDSVAIGNTSVGTITVTNTGGVSALLGTATMPAAPFSLTADGCSAQTLNASATCAIEVQFAPTVAGEFPASFSIDLAGSAPSNGVAPTSTTMFVMSSTLDPAATPSADPLMIVDTMVNSTNTGTLTITNSGDVDLVITGATGLAAPFSSDDSACTAAPIAPMATCDIIVTFAPTAEVTSMGTLSVASNDPVSPLGVAITATGTEQLLPNIMVTPAALVFPTPLLIGTMAMDTITVSNMGTADLTLTAIATTPDPSADFSIDDDCVSPLAPMGSCTITVTFAPMAGGPLTASVTIDSDDVDTPVSTVMVSGTGVVPEANIMLSATALNLGVVTIGNSTMRTVTVSNMGTANLDVTSVTLPAGDYTQTNNCTATDLLPMATCLVTITFAPTTAATITETLTIMSTDLDSMVSTVALTGRGVIAPEPNIASNVTTLDFGTGLFGETIDRSVVIENNGDAILAITDVAITGADAAEFTLGGNCAIGTLAAGADCTATIQFAPGAPAGAKLASLTVVSDDVDTPSLEVTLTGTSEMPVPEAMFSTTSIAFGDLVTGSTSTRMLTITNNGTGELTVSMVAFQGAIDAAFAIDMETCTATPVAVSGSCDVTVSFTPSAEGAVSGEIGISTDDPAALATAVTLTGTGVVAPAPDITADVMSLTFGSVLFGDTGVLNLTITNAGDADLTISGVTIAPAGDFTSATVCGVLAPAASCIVEVTYAPSVEGDVTAVLSVASDDADTPSLDVALTGTGVPLEPEIEVSATDLMFGSIVVGTTEAMSLTVSNSGMADLTIGSVTVSGTDQASFSQTNDCATVAMNSSCTVIVTYEPAAIGDATATLTVVSNDADEGSIEIALAGTATPVPMPMISVAPTLDIGEVTAGQTGAGTISVRNIGSADLLVTNVTITGTNASDFTQTNMCGTVAAGGTCNIALEFTPSVEGAVAANVVITSNDAASPTTVAVSATALVPVPVVSTDILDLGSVRIGESGNATVTISNTGSADLVVLSVVLSGMGAADFTLTNACTTVVAGATCSIRADFTPNSVGAKSAAITVTTNDPVLAAFAIALRATGAPREEIVVSVNSKGGNGSFGLVDLCGLMLLVALARRFRVRAVLLAFAAVCAPLTLADNHEGVDSYWYAGAGFGSSDGQADPGAIKRGIEEAGVTVTSLNIDDSDSGYKLFAGYQATEHLAVEVGYVDLGEAGIDLQLGDVTLEQLPLISRTVSGNLSLLGSGVFGAIVAKQSINERFGLIAKVGLVSWEIDTAIGGGTSVGALNIEETESGTDFLFGVGVEASFGEGHKFGVRGEWERFELGEEDAEFLSIGMTYRF